MSNSLQSPSFLTEIQEAKRAVNDWPQWMKNGTQAVVTTAPDIHTPLSSRIAEIGDCADDSKTEIAPK